MTLVKISNVGDGRGALSVSRGGPIPTYGEQIETDDRVYQVTEVRRFASTKRLDSVLVDVEER